MATTRATTFRLLTLLTCLSLVVIAGALTAPARAQGATFVVNDLGDAPDATLDGTCATAGGVCTLRAAIEEANNDVALDTITFSVAGTIEVVNGTPIPVLPDLSQPVTINGLSAPGATCTNQTVILDGGGSAAFFPISAPNVTVTGLALTDAQFGIGVFSTDAVITCNRIGETPAGTAAPLTGWAISVSSGGTNVRIGGPGEGNIFRSNNTSAPLIELRDTNGFEVRNNTIADNAGSSLVLANSTSGTVAENTITGNTGATTDGIYLVDAANGNVITGNTLTNNGRHGILIDGNSTINNQITQNAISANTDRGIALGNPRATNDAGDTDFGPNNLQNYPVLTAAVIGQGGVLTTTIDVASTGFAVGSYTIEVFEALVDEGLRYLGSATVDENDTSFTLNSVTGLAAGESIVATATDANGNTSEFSDAQLVAGVPEIAVSYSGGSLTDGATVAVGSVVQPTDRTTVITVANDGTVPLTLSTPTLNNTTGTAFSLNTSGFQTSLNPGANTTFSVILDGATVGSFAADISITNNDSDENPFNFSVTGSVTATPVPAISVNVGGEAVTDGQATPVSFGSTISGTAVTKVITISNNGTANLTLDPLPSLSPTTGFELIGTPTSPVAPGGDTTFQVRLSATAAGTFTSTLSFGTNVTGQNPFNFPISGTVTLPPEPEIAVTQGTTAITSGQTTPVNFGTATRGRPVSVTFTISNTGTANLTLSNLSLPTGYALVGTLPPSIAPGASGELQVRLTASATGTFSGTVQFTTNDRDEGTFSFPVTGRVVQRTYLPFVVK